MENLYNNREGRKMQDLDTMTNVILNNEYELHEEKELNNKNYNNKNHKRKKDKKRTLKQKVFFIFKLLTGLVVLTIIFIFLFFKTSLFQKYKELWVVTAMSTMNHQYLATWFLSDEEIQEILDQLEVENNEDSNSNEIKIEVPKEEHKEITVEKISGKNYVGYVMIVPDASKVKLVDGRQKRKRLKTK